MTRRAGLLILGASLLGLAFRGPSDSATPDFAGDVLPTLTKATCNSGACHGAAKGQGGFKLSLLGSDPQADYDTITRELGMRRIRLDAPDKSLIIQKPGGKLPHGGGLRLPEGSEAYQTVLAWLQGGAPAGNIATGVERLVVEPASIIGGPTGKIKVNAVLSDGAIEDRTNLALFTPLDETVASVSPTGEVKVLRRGVTDIMIRYRGQVAAVRAGAPLSDTPIQPGSLAGNNPIDKAVLASLQKYRIPPSPRSTDAEFMRRASLVLTGRLPHPDRVRSYLDSPDTPAKRAAYVDELLASDAFDDLWAMHLSDWMLISGPRVGHQSARQYHAWLRAQLTNKTPLDQVVRALVTASGSLSQPETGFYRLTQDPRDMSEFVGRTLLGKRLACARCHNHPYDKWTQGDYHRFAAIFAKIKVEGDSLVQSERGAVDDPKTGKPVSPALLGSKTLLSVPDARVAFADSLTKNDDFSRAFSNLVWKHLVGRGIVEPVDDIRPTNPPSNPELLDVLAKTLRDSGYDLRTLVRSIVLSNTFQLSSQTTGVNSQDQIFFSRSYVRSMPGPLLADALADTTGVPFPYPTSKLGTRAVQLPFPTVNPNPTLTVLGTCTRDPANPGAVTGGGLAAALHLINASEIEDRVRSWAASLQQLSGAELSNRLYLTAFSRFPTDKERAYVLKVLGEGDRKHAIEDLVWALLHSKEFGSIK